MSRFLVAASLNKSDLATDIDGPEPSWQLAQQGPSVPSKEKSGIQEKESGILQKLMEVLLSPLLLQLKKSH